METKTYRGRSLDEILPRIKAELGPDALITRQRNGLTGGVGGFFQRECIEVEARPPERRFDAYDEEPERAPEFVADELPPEAATSEGLNARAIQEMLASAAPFAEHLSLAERGAAAEPAEPEPAPAPEAPPAAPAPQAPPAGPAPQAPPAGPAPQAPPAGPVPQPPLAAHAPQARPSALLPASPPSPSTRPPQADALEQSLADAGVGAALAHELVAETVTHTLPFSSPRSLKRLVRAALARRIPVAPSAPGAARSLAFVGPGGAGKTLCAARIAAAYAAAGDLQVVCVALRPADGGTELRSLLEPLGVSVFVAANGAQARALADPARENALVVVDTPAVTATATAAIEELASDLTPIELGEIHVTLPATVSGPAARELLEALAPLGVSRVALTHSDDSRHAGGLVGAVISTGTPISFVSGGSDVPGGVEPASADALAGMVVT